MLLRFKPEQLDEESVGFTGFIEIRMPSYPERLRLPKEIGIENVANMASEADKDKVRQQMATMEVLAKTAEKIMTYINEVDLVYADGDEVTSIKTMDDFFAFPACAGLVTGLCSKFVLGFMEKKKLAVSEPK